MKIQHIQSPNFSSRDGIEVDVIVIHCASLPEGRYGTGYITDLFLNRLHAGAHSSFESLKRLRVSAHYLIERDGAVIQYVDTDDKAWHAGVSSFEERDNCNRFSIGIELEGDIHSEFTEKQYTALIELCRALLAKYPKISADRIVRHSDIAPRRKQDPGPFFQLGRIQKGVVK